MKGIHKQAGPRDMVLSKEDLSPAQRGCACTRAPTSVSKGPKEKPLHPRVGGNNLPRTSIHTDGPDKGIAGWPDQGVLSWLGGNGI